MFEAAIELHDAVGGLPDMRRVHACDNLSPWIGANCDEMPHANPGARRQNGGSTQLDAIPNT